MTSYRLKTSERRCFRPKARIEAYLTKEEKEAVLAYKNKQQFYYRALRRYLEYMENNYISAERVRELRIAKDRQCLHVVVSPKMLGSLKHLGTIHGVSLQKQVTFALRLYLTKNKKLNKPKRLYEKRK